MVVKRRERERERDEEDDNELLRQVIRAGCKAAVAVGRLSRLLLLDTDAPEAGIS